MLCNRCELFKSLQAYFAYKLVLLTKQIELLNNQLLLVGVSVPHLLFYTEGPASSAEELAAPGPFEMKVLRDFVGFVSIIPLIPAFLSSSDKGD